MKKAKDICLEQSLEWIRNHPFATNHDVPEELRQLWAMDEDPTGPSEGRLSIFAFGYTRRLLLSDDKPPEEPRKVSMQELLEHFKTWQLKLALCELHRLSEVRSKPLPLFAFPANEVLECCPIPYPAMG